MHVSMVCCACVYDSKFVVCIPLGQRVAVDVAECIAHIYSRMRLLVLYIMHAILCNLK